MATLLICYLSTTTSAASSTTNNRQGSDWCNVVGCFIGSSVDSKLRGAAIEIEQCVEAMTTGIVGTTLITDPATMANAIGRLIATYYTSVPGKAFATQEHEKKDKRKGRKKKVR